MGRSAAIRVAGCTARAICRYSFPLSVGLCRVGFAISVHDSAHNDGSWWLIRVTDGYPGAIRGHGFGQVAAFACTESERDGIVDGRPLPELLVDGLQISRAHPGTNWPASSGLMEGAAT